MPVFHYDAVGVHGERYAGTMSAKSAHEVLLYIKQNKGTTVAIERHQEHEPALRLFHVLFSFVSLREWAVWCTSLSRLLKAGIPILQALRLLSRQIRSPVVERALREVADDIVGGSSFSGALKNHEGAFPGLLPLLAEAGERSGKLEEMMTAMGDFLQQRERFRHRLRRAMIYPVLLAVTSAVAGCLFFWVVLPRLDHFYAAFSLTRPSLSLGSFIIPLLVILFCGAWYLLYRPFLLWKKAQLALFRRTFGLLLQAGINYLDAIALACSSISFFPGCQKQQLQLVAGLEKGELLTDLLCQWPELFDPMTLEILRSGEASGSLETSFFLCAEQTESMIKQMADSWMLSVQPAFILVMTLFVGTLLYHLVLPIFQLALILPDQL